MKYYLAAFSCLLLTACIQTRAKEDIVVVDGNIALPIDGCMEAQKKIMGNTVKPREFCSCLVSKMYYAFKNDPAKVKLMMAGEMDDVARDSMELIATFYPECISRSATNDSTRSINITPRMATTIKAGLKKNLEGTTIGQTNDLDRYCDCLVEGMQAGFTAREIMRQDFNQSVKFKALAKKCLQATLKR